MPTGQEIRAVQDCLAERGVILDGRLVIEALCAAEAVRADPTNPAGKLAENNGDCQCVTCRGYRAAVEARAAEQATGPMTNAECQAFDAALRKSVRSVATGATQAEAAAHHAVAAQPESLTVQGHDATILPWLCQCHLCQTNRAMAEAAANRSATSMPQTADTQPPRQDPPLVRYSRRWTRDSRANEQRRAR